MPGTRLIGQSASGRDNAAEVTDSGALKVTVDDGVARGSDIAATNVLLGPVDEAAPATDTASSGHNGRLQRIAQRLTAILQKLPAFGTVSAPSADVMTVQGAAGARPLKIANGVVGEDSFNASGAISINTQLLLRDCSDCSAVSIQVQSMGAGGAIAAEWSNNGTNFGTASTASTGSGSQAWGSITAAGLFVIPRLGKWLQLRMSTATSGGATSLSIALLADSPMVNAVAQLNGGSTQIVGSVVQGYSASAAFAGATKTSIFSDGSTNAALIKGSAGKVFGFWFTNTTAAHVMIRLFNLAAPPTLGTSATLTRIVVPPNGFVTSGLEGGYLHSVGIAIAITAGLNNSDGTAVGVGAIIGELFTV